MVTRSSEKYWNELTVSDTDVEHVYGYLLEHAEPTSLDTLLALMIERRIAEEEKRRAQMTADAKFYQPRATYEIGQSLVFTALNNRQGIVQSIRASDNPRLPSFQVLSVQFSDDGSVREFAAGYELPHGLNDIVTTMGASDMTREDVLAQFGEKLGPRLETRLHSDKDFIEQNGKWLLKGLLAQINQGHVNLAEAAIEQGAEAMTTADLARVLELTVAGKESTAYFSLEHSLSRDPQFEDVGPRGERRWYLTRLEPEEARAVPPILELTAQANALRLPPELESIYTELESKTESDDGIANEASGEVTLVLTYPHRRAGSLPLNNALRQMLPVFDHPRLRVALVDGQTQARLPGWVARDGKYIVGLRAWYEAHKLHPGAVLMVRRGPEPLTLIVDYTPQRERSLWVRVARTQNGRLTFAQEKKPLAHKYDEEMLAFIGDPLGLDALEKSPRRAQFLPEWITEVFPELAKLSAGGRVHAKTLYAALNFGKRATPGAFMQALLSNSTVSSVGGGYYVLEAVKDLVS